MTNKLDAGESLSDAVKDFVQAISDLSSSVKQCREAGLSNQQMHDVIMASVPEEDRPVFAQQWPMISMMLSAL